MLIYSATNDKLSLLRLVHDVRAFCDTPYPERAKLAPLQAPQGPRRLCAAPITPNVRADAVGCRIK